MADYLDCRECKRSIVEAIGLSLLQQGQSLLRGTQKLVITGCFSGENENDAWSLSLNEPIPELTHYTTQMQRKAITECGDTPISHGLQEY